MQEERYSPQELAELEALLDAAEQDARRALAWEECLNAYCAHVLHYHGQQQRKDLEDYWSQDRDDIAYGHGDGGHIGKSHVVRYFAGMNEMWREVKLKYFSEKYPDRVKNTAEFNGVGDYCIHAIFSPCIQVSDDLQTATAYLHSPAICSELDLNGQQGPMIEWGGYGVTFHHDQAGWRIWQIRGYNDYTFFWKGEIIDNTDRPDPPYPPVAEQLRQQAGKAPIRPEPNFTVTGKGVMQRFRVAKVEPEMQPPYDTWDESLSYVRDYFVPGEEAAK